LKSAVASLAIKYDALHVMTKEELEYKALKILERQPHLTQRQLSKELGVSLGKAHYVIKCLIHVGWLKLDNFQRSKNKWGYAYLVTPKGIAKKAAITARFLVAKQREHKTLLREIAQLQEEVAQCEIVNDVSGAENG
jgi:EPS-associated MarR family transcriptional regulator